MSGVAKQAKLQMPKIAEYTPPSNLRVNLKVHKGMDTGTDVGKRIRFRGHGKITAINKDEIGHTMSIDVHHIKPEGV